MTEQCLQPGSPRDLKILSCPLSPATLVPFMERRERHRPTEELGPQTGHWSPPLLTGIKIYPPSSAGRGEGAWGGKEPDLVQVLCVSISVASASRATRVHVCGD